MSNLDIYDKIDLIINKKSLEDGNIINVGNFEIVAEPEYYMGMGVKTLISYRFFFRKKDKPQFCYIEFQVIEGNSKNSIKLYIDEFSCSYAEKTKGEGLKMLVALANYIHNKAKELGVQCSDIELTALPIGKKEVNSNDLINLVHYYQSIGFNMVDITEEELISHISDYKKYGVSMEVDFNSFLEMHRSLLTGGKKNKSKKNKKRYSKKRYSKKENIKLFFK